MSNAKILSQFTDLVIDKGRDSSEVAEFRKQYEDNDELNRLFDTVLRVMPRKPQQRTLPEAAKNLIAKHGLKLLVVLSFLGAATSPVSANSGIDLARYFDRLEDKLDKVLDVVSDIDDKLDRKCK